MFFQTVLNDPILKITESKDVRWLSHDAAMQSIRRCHQSLIVSLDREGVENHELVAEGLARHLQTYQFMAALMMFCDALPILSQLSRAMQVQLE